MTEPQATILVVDDSRAKRYLLTSWLRRAGYGVAEAENGASCLETLRRGGVDAVVLDVNLPDISGYEVCERIKSDPVLAAVPVMHISATAIDVADRTAGLSRGADAYLAEPIEPDELVATLRAMLRYYSARRRAERLAERLARLAETTLAVNAATTFEAVLSAAVEGVAEMYGGPATVAALTPDGRHLLAGVAGPGEPPLLRPWLPPDLGDPIAVAGDGTIVRVPADPAWGSLPPWFGRYAELWVAVAQPRPNRRAAYIAVPAPVIEPDDANILTQLGQGVAQALEALRSLDEERRIALTLQRSLLPRSIPELPGYDIAVRYEPASERIEVGGDFYELARLGDQLVVAIGDVAGHSLHTATIMAELRHALRAYVVEGHRPHDTLRRLNDLMLHLVPDEIASMCLALLQPATGRLRLANAGHMPPLVVCDGHAELLTLPGSILGVAADPPVESELGLPPGATLLLYTDGLIERRDESIDDGLARLVRAAATVEPDLGEFTGRLLRELGAGIDDVAVVALRRHPDHPS